MFTNVSTKLGYGLKLLYFNTENQHFNRRDIVTGLNALTTNIEDIIIFYYTGYGVYQIGDNSNFPSLKLQNTGNKFLSKETVAKTCKNEY